jgi:olfactory receptor
VSFLDSQLHNLAALPFTCYKEVEISSFFCDPAQLFIFSCSHTFAKSVVMYFIGSIFGFLPISGILFSYYKIVSSILKIPSSSGRYKAFSTYRSHLPVVYLFYGTGIAVYLGSTVSPCPSKCMVPSLIYTAVTPMLNPFIYSPRNRNITRAK